MNYLELRDLKARVIAFYLPQFYPTKENDEWWGPGFTEWTNVAKARPLFKGHAQPNIPGRLGFYDLRLRETRQEQAELARIHGIEGFCYWHYWFGNGVRVLDRVFDEVLSSGEPDFPFCLGWANETWTGIWHGAPKKILVEQNYPGETDDIEHFNYLARAFLDPRYIKLNGRPIFVIYKPLLMRDARRRLALWRKMAKDIGLPGLHFVGLSLMEAANIEDFGLDALIISKLGSTFTNSKLSFVQRAYWGIRRRLPLGSLRVIEYKKILRNLLFNPKQYPFPAYQCIVPNWDNTPRSGERGMVVIGSTPALFEEHVQLAVAHLDGLNPHERIVFLKSWNEWAEGNYIEPDRKYGELYLQALRRAISA